MIDSDQYILFSELKETVVLNTEACRSLLTMMDVSFTSNIHQLMLS